MKSDSLRIVLPPFFPPPEIDLQQDINGFSNREKSGGGAAKKGCRSRKSRAFPQIDGRSPNCLVDKHIIFSRLANHTSAGLCPAGRFSQEAVPRFIFVSRIFPISICLYKNKSI